jgi:hypothetical protein
VYCVQLACLLTEDYFLALCLLVLARVLASILHPRSLEQSGGFLILLL